MSVLYIVPTPIGNLNDMVPRAVQVLQQVDLIAAEDTRHSAALFRHFDIRTQAVPYHEHNESEQAERLLAHLSQGKTLALISDAGTPLVSDPGYRLVSEAQTAGFRVVPIPGAVAAMAALSASGLASDRFCFEGFLPAKSAKRQAALKLLSQETRTIIFYESTHRIVDMVTDLIEVFGGDRNVCVAREISKQFETIKTALAGEILTWMQADSNQQRGEFVVIVGGAQVDCAAPSIDAFDLVLKLAGSLPPNKASALAAEISGLPKRELYQYLMDNK